MNFEHTHAISGTSLQGYIETTYKDLVKAFGNPDIGPNVLERDKTTCEWGLLFDDGTVATIYDWKVNYTPTESYYWHIGGKSEKAVDLVTKILQKSETLESMSC
ncbi:hypothetical protein [Caudoviricetes sp.]|nr:hypothetical protein [Caudoviricetes sp.]